ncbi:hypothetical protein Dsin_001029 [Dipteronia sinensis]|uniref:RNase H type-1 domain-containing protein n=1 Tax=Dipteronia sinensis TaxID=43782 RepID=A0AAE0EHZ6_9ROSI|nr:hypothetical protein Dsin_001029 [Dipteronia sinensis]
MDPPDPGMFKINCDAAIDATGRLVGFGIGIRNSNGFVLASSSQRIEATFSLQVAKTIAIFHGLQLAFDSGLHPCRIDSDVKVIVDWINIGVLICSEVGSVIADIHILLEQV